MKSRLLRGSLIGLCAVIISTLGIYASDTLQGVDSRIGNLANLSSDGVCPLGMALFRGPEGLLCVDIFEASPSADCPNSYPKNVMESEKNASTNMCSAISVQDREPWTYVTLSQAQRACAEGGKRLPTSDEWYTLALGTDEETCEVDGKTVRVTGVSECISSAGMHDMIGNVWEWVNETVEGSQFRGRTLPEEGYVAEADASGLAITTQPTSGDELYGNDYFWSKNEGVFGMIRGGFYGSGKDAGLYAVNASVPTNLATLGVGFRCVSDVI